MYDMFSDPMDEFYLNAAEQIAAQVAIEDGEW